MTLNIILSVVDGLMICTILIGVSEVAQVTHKDHGQQEDNREGCGGGGWYLRQ